MTPIHVTNLAAPTEGARSFDKSPLSFGRDATCDIMLPTKHASRKHGELHFDKDQWWLINRSPNGTLVAGKNVTTHPRALRDRDVIAIGDQAMFEVRIAAPAPASGVTAVEPKSKKRTALWTGLGVYLAAMLALVLFLSTLKPSSGRKLSAPELTDEQIAEAIRKPLPPVLANERDMRTHLQEARELYSRPTSSPDTLFHTYQAYRKALAYSGKPQFEDGLDQRQFFDVEGRFIREVQDRYRAAYQKVMSGQYAEAEDALRALNLFYNDSESAVYLNVQKQREIAAQHAKKKKRW